MDTSPRPWTLVLVSTTPRHHGDHANTGLTWKTPDRLHNPGVVRADAVQLLTCLRSVVFLRLPRRSAICIALRLRQRRHRHSQPLMSFRPSPWNMLRPTPHTWYLNCVPLVVRWKSLRCITSGRIWQPSLTTETSGLTTGRASVVEMLNNITSDFQKSSVLTASCR